MEKSQLKKLTLYKLIRFSQMAFVICFACWLAFYFHIEHGYWIPFTICIVYASIDEASVKVRMKARVFGTLFGLILCYFLASLATTYSVIIYPVYFLLYFFIFLLIPYYFFAVIFITTSVIWTGLFINVDQYNLEHLMVDRLINTLIGAAICYSFEVLFQTHKLSHKLISQNIAEQCKAMDILVEKYKRNEHTDLEAKSTRKKIRESIFELNAQINMIPFSFSKGFSEEKQFYQKKMLELKHKRSETMNKECIAKLIQD